MANERELILVDIGVLPEVFGKVLKAKQLLAIGAVKNISEAVDTVGISRSAFYKYKDSIFPFYEKKKEMLVTLSALLKNEPGVLSAMMNCFAEFECNVLTINQNIPSNGVALVTVSLETTNMSERVVTL